MKYIQPIGSNGKSGNDDITVELQQQSKSIASIDAVMYAFRWAHTIADVPSPTEHQFFVSTWRGCKRLLARPVQPKGQIEVSALHRLAADFERPTLVESRLLVLCLLCYSGALSIQAVLQIRVKDIVFSETSMRLFIPKRENYQYRDGHHVTIASTSSITCPYTTTKHLISAGKLGPDFHLIGRIVHTKNGQLCKPTSISYSRARDILRDGLSKYLSTRFQFWNSQFTRRSSISCHQFVSSAILSVG